MITAGEPGSVAPYTFMFGETSCISYHIEGSERRRCGSLHKIGFPLFVFEPLTAQLFEPVISSGLEMIQGKVSAVSVEAFPVLTAISWLFVL